MFALASVLVVTLSGMSIASAQTRGPRPGPDILYRRPARAPQLENAPGSIWQADPILVSGASAYRNGEFLYQDFLYDDSGAGSYAYPTNPRYAGNAADIVEVRLKLLADATALRITYNSMTDPALVAATIALGGGTASAQVPHGANATEPATVFVTAHGSAGDIVNAASGTPLSVAPAVSSDVERRQVDVRVPFAAFDPRGERAVRVAVAAGLWDQATGSYLVPEQSADDTHPGGAPAGDSSPAAFFNVAFRYDEPGSGFRNSQQGGAVSSGDLSPFFASVDFTKLAGGVNDDMPDEHGGVPTHGFMDRIYASHFEDRQGRGVNASNPSEAGLGHAPGCQTPCQWQYSGQLQPYELYVPEKQPPDGFGYVVDLHGCNNPYNANYGTVRQQQLGGVGGGSLVATGEGRGDCYWYYGEAGDDPFEIWADVARHYRLDPDRAWIAGVSMGGYGTYKLATTFPDLFAAAAPTIPCPSAGVYYPPDGPPPGGEGTVIANNAVSLRHVPVMPWSSPNDPTCQYNGSEGSGAVVAALDSLGYRYDSWLFPGPEHFGLAIYSGSQAQPQADFLGNYRVTRDPAHISYVLNGTMNETQYGLDADHAYWAYGLRLRDASGAAPRGQIDLVSHGVGVGDPTAGPTQHGAGVLTGGTDPALAYLSQSREWGPAPAQAVSDQIDVVAKNIARVIIWAPRAHVSCHAKLNVTSDGPIDVQLAGCDASDGVGTGAASSPRACAATLGFRSVSARPRGRRVRMAFARRAPRPASVSVFQVSHGRRVLGERLVARFRGRMRAFMWNGRANVRGRHVGDGLFFVRYAMTTPSGHHDVRRVVLERRRGRFTRRPSYDRRADCGLVTSFKLEQPAFGGRSNRALHIAFLLGQPARVRLDVLRAGRVVRSYGTRSYRARRTYRLRLASEHCPRGDYRVRLAAVAGSRRVTSVLVSRRL